jgi:hypothetical protein
MALKFDWSHYIGVQMEWADVLTTRAPEIRGYDTEFLYAKQSEILADLNRRFRRELSDIVLLRRLERRKQMRRRMWLLDRPVDMPDREAI